MKILLYGRMTPHIEDDTNFDFSGSNQDIDYRFFSTFAYALVLKGNAEENVVKLPYSVHCGVDTTIAECLRKDIIALCSCTELHMLPNWEMSKNACLINQLAHTLGIKVVYIE